MAAEAMDLEYLFTTSRRTKHKNPFKQEEAEAQKESEAFLFRHNCLHDVESTWWCGIWLFFFKRLTSVADETPVETAKRQWETSRLFPGVPLGSERSRYLHMEYKLTQAFNSLLSVKVKPEEVGLPITWMMADADQIVLSYKTFEKDLASKARSALSVAKELELHNTIKDTFAFAKVSLMGQEIASIKVEREWRQKWSPSFAIAGLQI